ncbi:MAG: MoxR family ATPase [Candidatus Korarchaeota archaeon]|nr:MoxR family ATPase [Thermoproteota archaeon]MCR8454847.1 MoxR family ATPase [Thermoproteota archaeon]MCR8463714.1 MoxR family ATPase [Thermoproteota archaeon]MCR8471567.1 MoxR family ATPase [Thermoproteota archaeon]MCR8472698.1 MoxR family ATPase [Thermoproteota archaeon]
MSEESIEETPEEILIDENFVKQAYDRVYRELKKAIIGMDEIIKLTFISILSGGHILLEGMPGVGKTYLAQNFANSIGATFKRIQMTPDMLPADILGSYIYDQKEGTFKFRRGPIFANIILADEINRAPPKTQAALLEAMEERQVTIEGVTYKLPEPFLVIATQNPVELEGTYPLPEAQLSRFMMYLFIDYPTEEEELEILKLKLKTTKRVLTSQVISSRTILEMQKFLQTKVDVSEEILRYIKDIIMAIRRDSRVLFGCSPRESISLLLASKAHALINGRAYVVPDDVKAVAPFTLPHRVFLKPEVELGGVKPIDIITTALESVPSP